MQNLHARRRLRDARPLAHAGVDGARAFRGEERDGLGQHDGPGRGGQAVVEYQVGRLGRRGGAAGAASGGVRSCVLGHGGLWRVARGSTWGEVVDIREVKGGERW